MQGPTLISKNRVKVIGIVCSVVVSYNFKFKIFTFRRIIVTWIVGQDGTFLAEFLLNMGYVVYGI